MDAPHPGQVTRRPAAAVRDDPHAADELLPLVYEPLRTLARRRMAHERPGPILQPTALVHETYLRLVGGRDRRWENRAQFFSAAATAMRRILIERARRSTRRRHGAGWRRVSLDETTVGGEAPVVEFIALDRALGKLKRADARMARIVRLRFVAGLTVDETARTLHLSRTTVKDESRRARAWLVAELEGGRSCASGTARLDGKRRH